MFEHVAIDARPSRLARVLAIVVAGGIALAPAAFVPGPTVVARETACEKHRERAQTVKIETRARGVNPRYLQRELEHRR